MNKWIWAGISGLALLGYAHLTIGDQIAFGLTVAFYAIESVALVGLGLFTLYMVRQFIHRIEMDKATLDKARAEAKQAGIITITAPQGHQLAIRDDDLDSYWRLPHLSVDTHMNGRPSGTQPNATQLAIYQQFHGRQQSSDAVVIDQPPMAPEDIMYKYNRNWLDGLLSQYHVQITGGTGSGKTTLANEYLKLRLQQQPNGTVYLVNPKHIEGKQPFIVDPVCKDISEAMSWLAKFHQIMMDRKRQPSRQDTPVTFVIDEWDWIYGYYGDEAARLAKALIKVGRELAISVLLIGQSPLVQDTGLSGSDYDNFCRVGILRAGEKLLNSLVMDKGQMSPYRQEFGRLKKLNDGLQPGDSGLIRYCLVTSQYGDPSIELIPHINASPVLISAPIATAKKPVAKPTPEEMKIFRAWRDLGGKGTSWNKVWQSVTGNQSNVSSKKAREYRQLFDKYGVKYA